MELERIHLSHDFEKRPAGYTKNKPAGIDTNLDFQFEILSNPVYQDGHKIDTGFIPDQFPEYCK